MKWSELSMTERNEVIKMAVAQGIRDIPSIKNLYEESVNGSKKFKDGESTVGKLVDAIYENNPREEYLGEPAHHYDFTQSEEWANAHGYYPDAIGHRDDRVKKPAHPSHPSRGMWDGNKFILSDFGMETPNYTLFGLNDGGQDPQATLVYNNGIVLPELTVTPNGNYVENPYDNLRLHFADGGTIDGGIPFKITVTGKDRRPAWKRMYQNPNLGDTSQYYNGNILEDALSFTPVIGDAIDAVKAVDAVNRGNYLEAGVLGGSLLLPNAVEKPVKAVSKLVGKGIKKITKENAAKILSSEWTAAQDAAIAKGDMVEAQRLRDLHSSLTDSATPGKYYRGTQTKRNSYPDRHIDEEVGEMNGIYLTKKPKYAKTYGDSEEFYLRSNNPLETEGSWTGVIDDATRAEIENAGYDAVVNNRFDTGFLNKLLRNSRDETITFNGKNLKLADAVTYDDAGTRIPLGERDNFSINDIRYAIAPFLIGGAAYGLSNEKAYGGSIHIAPSKKGTFTAAASKHGMGVQEFASKVLSHPEDYSLTMRKKANFARNASKWKH